MEELNILVLDGSSASAWGDEDGWIDAERGCVDNDDTLGTPGCLMSFGASEDLGESFANPGRANGGATRWSKGAEDAFRFLSSYSRTNSSVSA